MMHPQKESGTFYRLGPHEIMMAVEKAGMVPSGEFLQLNSYENRVFDITLDDDVKAQMRTHVVAKFYRPGRWDKYALLEEHEFMTELRSESISVGEPLILKNNSTLIESDGLFVAFFRKGRGRLPQEFLHDDLKQVGKLLAQVHNIGSRKDFRHRPVMNEDYVNAWPALEILDTWVAPEISQRYFAAATHILQTYEDKIQEAKKIRIHGDCHRGNLLHNGDDFVIVDFDDCLMGPAVQDFWMLLSGEDVQTEELDQILSGYEEIRHFNESEIELIPILQGVRILSYAAWIAKRWEDPFFKQTFSEFNSYRYWVEETEAIEKIAWKI